jgi:hypothetical protein
VACRRLLDRTERPEHQTRSVAIELLDHADEGSGLVGIERGPVRLGPQRGALTAFLDLEDPVVSVGRDEELHVGANPVGARRRLLEDPAEDRVVEESIHQYVDGLARMRVAHGTTIAQRFPGHKDRNAQALRSALEVVARTNPSGLRCQGRLA